MINDDSSVDKMRREGRSGPAVPVRIQRRDGVGTAERSLDRKGKGIEPEVPGVVWDHGWEL